MPVDLSLSHNRPVQIFQSFREKKDRPFCFPSLVPYPLPLVSFRSVWFRGAMRLLRPTRGWHDALLFSPFRRKSLCQPSLVATLFSHDSRNSIQSSRRDLCRTLRSFVYRPFKVVFRGQPARHVFLAVSLYTFLPARNSNSSSPEEPKGEPDALDTRYATYHSESFCVRSLALVMDEKRSRECGVSRNFR